MLGLPLLAAATLGPVAYWATLVRVNGWRREGEPPLVRGWVPYLGVALAMGRNATTFIQACQARHGDVFSLCVAGRRMTFVLDPLSYAAVLKAKQLSFLPVSDEVMSSAFRVPKVRTLIDLNVAEDLSRTHLKGPDLEVMTSAMQRRLRGLIQSEQAEQANSATEANPWQTRALYRSVWETMFRAGTDALFGEGLVTPASADAFEAFDRSFPLMVAGLPRFLFKAGDEALHQLASGPKVGAEPSPWIVHREPLFTEVEPIEYGRMQASILWAINANTIPATFWSLLYLLRDPVGLAAVQAELASVIGAPDADGVLPEIDMDALGRLRLLDSAVREALRLSSGSMTVREVLEPFTLETRAGRFDLRAGDRVCLAPFIVHRDPEIFAEPERYQHDRFYVESGVKQFSKRGERVPLAWMPFGAGHSMCPGRFFAANEIKLFVAMTLLASEFELGEAALPEFDYSRAGLGIYPPVADVEVRVRRRARATVVDSRG